jgi:DNA-binding IclR family transcriptional regulator
MARPSKKKAASSIDRGGATTAKGKYTVPALEKAFEVIELLASTPGGVTMNEIATRLDRSLGELFRIVIVMERRGFLQKSPDTDRYTVAYKILELAYRATPAQDLTRAAAPVMQSLSSRIGQSCHLVVPNGGEGLVVFREENPGVRGFALRVGAPVDLISSCSGHVILAFSDDQQRERMLRSAGQLPRKRVNRAKFASLLAEVRKHGFDRCASPITHGVTDVSYPVFGFYGNLMAALTVPFLELIDGSQKVGIDNACRHLAKAAQSISATLGHHDSVRKSHRRRG